MVTAAPRFSSGAVGVTAILPDRMERILPKRPVNLRAQQAAASSNYVRLLRLIPAMRTQDQYSFRLHVPGTIGKETPIDTEVTERGPYTTLLNITQRPADVKQAGQLEDSTPEFDWNQLDLRMSVRVYHDAQMAEIVDFMNVRNFKSRYPYPNPKMLQIDEKQQVNFFLRDWLDRCLEFGVAVSPLQFAEFKA